LNNKKLPVSSAGSFLYGMKNLPLSTEERKFKTYRSPGLRDFTLCLPSSFLPVA